MTFRKLKKLISETKKIDMKQKDMSEVSYCFDLASDDDDKMGMINNIMKAFIHIIKFEDYKFQDKETYRDAVRYYSSLEKESLDNSDGRKFMFQKALTEHDLSELLALVDLLGYRKDFYNIMIHLISNLQMFYNTEKDKKE